MYWLLITELAAALAGVLLISRHYLHMLQLESYQVDGYMRHMKRTPAEWNSFTLITAAVCLIAVYVLPVVFAMFTGEREKSCLSANIVTLIGFLCAAGYSAYKDYRIPKKKDFVLTKRMKRLCAVHAGTNAVLLILCALIFTRESNGYKLMYIPPFCLIGALPFITALSARLAEPIEKKINMGFFIAARDKLAARKDMIKIGITGSYGKTGTKFALATILGVKYNVLTSTSSVNTPMGLSTLINNKLSPEHQVFIAEMGARHVGDIEELTRLVRPTVGLITSVGPQHLETFGDIETVAETKNELIVALPKDGVGVFASDNGWVDRLWARAKCEKLLSGVGDGDFDMRAENVEVGAFGSRFDLISRDGETIRCETPLLGRHNISNVVLCCCAARRLGLTMEEIASGVKLIKPVEHRLQLLTGGEMNVIDDAFNSNPSGAREALNVLASFPGRHVIVTPGLVEMGEDEDRFNFELGGEIAKVCDGVILIGPRHTRPILEGLLKAGFPKSNVVSAYTLDEGASLISRFAGAGDTVLFENDLPDNYNETPKVTH